MVDTQFNETTNQNSIKVPEVVEPTNIKIIIKLWGLVHQPCIFELKAFCKNKQLNYMEVILKVMKKLKVHQSVQIFEVNIGVHLYSLVYVESQIKVINQDNQECVNKTPSYKSLSSTL